MKIRIQGIDFNLIHSPQRAGDLDGIGFYDCHTAEIGLSNKELGCGRNTLIHEILEVLNHLNDLGLEHSKLSTIATGITQVLSDNPKLFEYKFNGIK